MDPLTHVLLGASVARATFGRRLGRTAAGVGGLAALLPDADVFIRSASDPLIAVEYHRGFTHALAFAPIGAAAVAALWLLRKVWRPAWLHLWGCATIAWCSHCLLDAATSYGTRLSWPFTDKRTAWHVISVVDPVFTLALVAGLVCSLISHRVRPVLIGLAVSALYLGAGAVQHARAADIQRRLAEERGHAGGRAVVMPTLANNVIWRALYLHQGRIYSDRIRVGWFSEGTVNEGWSLPLVKEEDLSPAEATRNAARRPFRRFSWFSDQWVARSPHDPALLADMRYSLSTRAFDPIWGIRFTEPGEDTDVVWVNRSSAREIDLREFLHEISGRDSRYRPAGPGAGR